ncbi:MAG TPA: von Willebrand factor type A domain-containing protein [Luteolibacter sp.]
MNEETPTPFDTVGDAPVEARIVAWVLGEASAFEAAELERLCEERPELLIFHRRMLALHGLLAEAETSAADPAWKLSAKKRGVLDEILGQENVIPHDSQQELRVRRAGKRAFFAIAACLVLAVVVLQLVRPIWIHQRGVRAPEKSVDFMPPGGGAGGEALDALEHLNRGVRDQEDVVEMSRKSLASIARTKKFIADGVDSENDIKRRADAQDYAEAKRKFETDQQLLQQMKLKQLEQTIAAETHKESLASNKGHASSRPASPATPAPLVKPAPGTYKVDSAAVASRRELGLQQAARQNQLAKQTPRAKSQEGDAGAALGTAAQDAIPASESIPSLALKGSVSGGLGGGEGIGRDRVFPTAPAKPSAPAEPALAASPSRVGGRAPANSIAMAGNKMAGDRFEAKLSDLDKKPAEAQAVDELRVEETRELAANEKSNYLGKTTVSAGVTTADAPIGGEARKEGDSGGVTNGLRSGDQAINRESIDDVLNHPNRTASIGKDASIKADAAKPPVLAAKDSSVSQESFGELSVLSSLSGGGLESGEDGQVSGGESTSRTNPALTHKHAKNVDQVRRSLYTAEGNFSLGKYADSKKAYEEVLRSDPYNSAARRGLEKIASAKSDYYRAAYDHTRAELLAEVDKTWELTVPTEPTDGAEEKNQSAGKISKLETKKSQPAPLDLTDEIPAAENPYSTFSLNISDVSFQMAKAALAKGERPDPESIKSEQFYNAVDYGDPAPTANEPVAATIEQSAHPFIPGRNLVRVALRTGSVGRSAAQPLRLTLLVDQSGSMVREDRRAAMEHALAQLGALLTKNDLVTVVGFSRTPHLLADGMTGDQAARLGTLVNQTASEGGTNLEEALKLGRQMAKRHQLAGAQNRIVLFTDGAANLGDADPARLAVQVKALRQEGVSFDIAGIGADGLNDKLLGEMARNGNGRYYVVGSEKNDSFARQLAGAFRPAAENVKVQMIFNPQRVGKYKLIGFEKDRLKTEDFRNDAVDAAELAAEEAGVAIYQVETLPEGTGEIGEVSVRFRDTSEGGMVERSWTIPHDARATAFDRATPSMQLAGLSLFAAEKLKGGPLGDAIDFKQLAGSTAVVKQFYGNSPRVSEMLQVIEKLK